MRVLADLELCQGHAMCVLEAPDVFAADDTVQILVAEPPESQHVAVRRAVRYCPNQALSLQD